MSVVELKSASAGHYYEGGHDGQYYASERGEKGEIRGSEWLGNLSADLELKGSVKAHDFQLLLNGVLPDGTQLKESGGRQTESGGRRAGYDFTNSMPKSFDVAGIEFQKDIKDIHREANAASMKYLESKLSTRVTENKKTQKVYPNSCAIASFTHHTSRADDPNTHTHNVVLNVTKAGGKIRAINGKDLYDMQNKVREIYFDNVARLAVEKGFAIRFEQTKSGAVHPELKNVSREQIEAFSKRAVTIQKEMNKKGFSDYEKSKQVARNTRQKKSGKTLEELRENWRKAAADVGVDFSKIKGTEKVNDMKENEIIGNAFAKAADEQISSAILRSGNKESDGHPTEFWADAQEEWKSRLADFDARRASNNNAASFDAPAPKAQEKSEPAPKEMIPVPAAEMDARIGKVALEAQAKWDAKNLPAEKKEDPLNAKLAGLKNDENALIKSAVGNVKGIETVKEENGKIEFKNSYFDSTRSFTAGKTQEAVTLGLVGTATELLNAKGERAGFAVKNNEGKIVGTAKSVGDGGLLHGYKPLHNPKQNEGREYELGSGYLAKEMLGDNGQRSGFMLSKDGNAIGTTDSISRDLVRTQKVQDIVGGGWAQERNGQIKIEGQKAQDVKFGESKMLGNGIKATSLYSPDGKFAGSLISQNGKAESFSRERLVKDPRTAIREKFEERANQEKSGAYFHSQSGGLMKRSFMNRVTGGKFGSTRKATFGEKLTHYAVKAIAGAIKYTAKGVLNAAVKDVERMVDNHRMSKLTEAGFPDKEARLMVAAARAKGDGGKIEDALSKRADALRSASQNRDAHDKTKGEKPAREEKKQTDQKEKSLKDDKTSDDSFDRFADSLQKSNAAKAETKDAEKPETKGAANPDTKAETKEAEKPEAKDAAKPEQQEAKQPDAKDAVQPETKEQSKDAEPKQSEAKQPDAKQPEQEAKQPESKETDKEAAKPESKAETKDAEPKQSEAKQTDVKESVQPESKEQSKESDKTETKEAAQPEAKTDGKESQKPDTKSESKDADKPEQQEAKQSEAKETDKAETKDAVKPEQSEAKETAQPDAKEADKAESKDAVQPDAKAETKEQPKETDKAESKEEKTEERSGATPGTTQSMNGSNVKSESVQREGEAGSTEKAESKEADTKDKDAKSQDGNPSSKQNGGKPNGEGGKATGSVAKGMESRAKQICSGMKERAQQKQAQQKQSQQKQASQEKSR